MRLRTDRIIEKISIIRHTGIKKRTILQELIFGFGAFAKKQGRISTIVEDQVGPVALDPRYGLDEALPVVLHGLVISRDGTSRVIFGAVNIVRITTYVGLDFPEGLNQHRR